MKIESVDYIYRKVPLDAAFKTASGGVSNSTCLFVRIKTDTDITGYGCGHPTSLTNEDNRSSLQCAELFSKAIIGKNPARIEHLDATFSSLTYHNPSVKSAFNIALWDILGKKYNAPLYELWGYDKPKIATSVTIGLAQPETMYKDAAFWVRKGFDILKVKLDSDPALSLEVLQGVRDQVGSDITIRCDANGAMRTADAIKLANDIDPLGIEFIEQPVQTLDEMGKVTSSSPLRIAGDEVIRSFDKFPEVLQKKAMHIANIKMNRFGGISSAIKMVAMAQAYGVPCMMGCMAETAISIAASLHVALACSNVKFADLDTFIFLKHQPATGIKIKKGIIQPAYEPGLGVVVDERIFNAPAKSENKRRKR
ncbi:MAG: mandelate racemase/muconate lactonizing enzyme family protein [Candidatus Methanofastidiosia archaeon]